MDELTIVGKGTIEALQIIEYDNGKFFFVYTDFWTIWSSELLCTLHKII